jgi:hypothetical protein
MGSDVVGLHGAQKHHHAAARADDRSSGHGAASKAPVGRTNGVTEPPREGVHRKDQLERFSVKREHNQHT